MNHEMGDLLVRDLQSQTAKLENLRAPLPAGRDQVSAFAH
jgi:hypothetical protein